MLHQKNPPDLTQWDTRTHRHETEGERGTENG